MVRFARVLATAIAFLAAGASALAVGEARVTLVPWEVLDPAETVDAPLVLFWIPATPDELRRSDLLTSYELTLFSSRCVAMRVVRFNDLVRLTSLEVGPEVPMVVLTDRAGSVVGRVEADDGKLLLSKVEELVREALDEREAEADALLDRARERAAGHDHGTAMRLYEAVWAERCVCPRQARDAKRAMKKLARK
jgi:hypothetical protein